MSRSLSSKPFMLASFCFLAFLQVQECEAQVLSTADRAAGLPVSPAEGILKRDAPEGIRNLATPQPPRSNDGQLPYRDKPLTAEQKKLLAGADEDRAKYADFLKQSDTGLVRLLPAVDHQTAQIVSANAPDRSLPIRGGGAFYSFAKKSHIFGPWSDLCLKDKLFFTEVANLSLGLLAALGDVPLEQVTLESEGVDYLNKMAIPTLASEASAQARRNVAGFTAGEFQYRSTIRALPNLTYVLRSVGYRRPDFLIVLPGTSVIGSSANVYQGNDVIVVFRLVREEADGAVTILWKRLKRSSAPQLKRDKK